MRIINKKARFDFDIKDEYICGIKLIGSEVKSIRNKEISFVDSYIVIVDNQVILKNLLISKYKNASFDSHDEKRDRQLLLTKREINKIKDIKETHNVSIVPIEIFTKGSLIKIKIGIGTGKKLYDKRMSIKERDIKRELMRDEKI